MASVLGGGAYSWKLTRDNDTEREYEVKYRVAATGPYNALSASGLPAVGASWSLTGETDTWAYRLPETTVDPAVEGEETGIYWVTCKFGTKPLTRCASTEKGNPLLEPIKITGSFQKYTKELWQNYDGTLIKSSSHEMIRGPQVEFDFNRPTVKIEMNVGTLQQNLLTQFVDCVNDTVMWGIGARCVKLSNVSWERLFYGVCSCYFRWTLEFDINFDSFDRFVPDEGTKCLRGEWVLTSPDHWVWQKSPTADKNNLMDFIRYQDTNGAIARVMLDGEGSPAEVLTALGTGTHVGTTHAAGANAKIAVKGYPGVNFALLGIPTTLVCSS